MNRRDFMRRCLWSSIPLLFPVSAYARMRCDGVAPFLPTVRCVADLNDPIARVNISADAGHKQRWCWAACIEMVFRYHRHPISKERIVAEAWGHIGNMPKAPGIILIGLNRLWRDDNGVEFSVTGKAVPPYVATQMLARNRPLIVGTHGNAKVLTSLTYMQNGDGPISVQAATVLDPRAGRGKHMLPVEEWHQRDFLVELRTIAVDSGGSGVLHG